MFTRRISSVFSLISLAICILMCILFCFELKSWGFSQMELTTLFVICVFICYVFASIVIGNQHSALTMFLVGVVMILFVSLQILGISLLKDTIQAFFIL